MQILNIPGTALVYDGHMGAGTFETVASLCKAAGGLSLSQVVGITGLEASTVQNWVKRGWVPHPKDKKYDERQIARILLISALRDCLPLEKIAQILGAVNGSVEDTSDDIIDEGELYNRFCAIVSDCAQHYVSPDEIRTAVESHLADYKGPHHDSKLRLFSALEIMTLAYQASGIKQLAERKLIDWLDVLPEYGDQ